MAHPGDSAQDLPFCHGLPRPDLVMIQPVRQRALQRASSPCSTLALGATCRTPNGCTGRTSPLRQMVAARGFAQAS
jgi:hypothetical protein